MKSEISTTSTIPRKISIVTQTYFEDLFYYSGLACLVFGFPILVINWYVGLIFLTIGLLVFTTAYKLTFDTENKTIEDYLFILGMKRDLKSIQYNRLLYIKIKSGKYTQQLSLRAASTTIEGIMYSAYLQTDNELLFLGESKSLKSITKKAQKLANKLNLELVKFKESN